MKILVIDGQGGKLGRTITEEIVSAFPQAEVIAVGTNSTAASNMLRGGAMAAATGENAVSVCCRSADVIIGPVGIVLADSMLGEITSSIACSVARSAAVKILIPVNKCGTLIAGTGSESVSALISDAMKKLAGIIEGGK